MLNNVFSELKIGNCIIPNRFVVPAMVVNYCTYDGFITDRYISYMEERAKGGYGLLITEDYAINENGKGYAKIPGLWCDEQMEGNKKLTEAVHKHGAKIFCQIYHPGKQTNPMSNGGVTPVAPSAIKDPVCQSLPREITVEEIHTFVKEFGEAAKRAKECGFDGIEIHAGHGYLIAQFLSPFINKRNDSYGGCFENRVRFLDELYAEMRKQVGTDFPIQVRFSANEYVTGGRTAVESYQLALHLEELGVDSLNVSNGTYASDAKGQIIAPMFTDHGLNVDIAGEIKKMVTCPVLVANRINNPGMADAIIATGKADAVCVGRGSIVDPEMPKKAKEGRFDEINYCIGCLQGCAMSLVGPKQEVDCLVNPRVGFEYKDNYEKAAEPKKVMVVGAGPAGLMAARTAALRGHDVTVYEATDHVGGAFRSAAYPSGKGELATVIASYKTQCDKNGVKFVMNTEVEEALMEKEAPDAIILATGSRPLMPPISGIDGANVATAEEILYGKKDILPGPTIVCGGGEVGAETAEFIASTSFFPVMLLEMQPRILGDMMSANTPVLMELLAKRQVQIITNAKVTAISEQSVSYEDAEGNTVTLPAGTVVSAFGYKAHNPLEEAAKKYSKEVYTIGSAVKAGNAMAATREGFAIGMKL